MESRTQQVDYPDCVCPGSWVSSYGHFDGGCSKLLDFGKILVLNYYGQAQVPSIRFYNLLKSVKSALATS